MTRRVLAVLAAVILLGSGALAHEVRPAYLEMRQTAADSYDILWKVPARGENLRLGLYVELPAICVQMSPPRGEMVSGSLVERWSVRCAGGLSGSSVHIAGLSATLTDVLVRVERLDGATQVGRLTPAAPTFVVAAAPRRLEVARTYVVLGIEHILTGYDHLLFVSGLLLLVSGFRRLVKTVSAFTVSHSVTLTLATLGFVNVPPGPVEALIALSIVFVACEILKDSQQPSLARRKPWLVAFSFGLLHGLGFAGGLSEAGLPAGHIPLALTFFSAGVEVGHFAFVSGMLLLLAALRRVRFAPPLWARPVPTYAIGGVAAYWVITRLVAL